MDTRNCVFGGDCPCHGLACSCDMRWSQMTEDVYLLNWGIEITQEGALNYFVYNENLQQLYMCHNHFLPSWGLTQVVINQMLADRHWRIRPVPEE